MRPAGASLDAGENIGCPTSEEEVNEFINKLKATSKLTPDQLEVIRKRFRQNE